MTAVARMTGSELKSTVILALIFACRLLGLFMVLPVLALYVSRIPAATPSLIGLAAGIYGFTQALLQLPFGLLSDYFGRKPIILIGLGIFAIGSLIAAYSDSMTGLIIGRAIQGAGAIGSPILALAADTTRDSVRTRVMACIGISIGATFVLAILLGPVLDGYFGLAGIFKITAFLAMLGMLLLLLIKAEPLEKPTALKIQIRHLLQHHDLWRLNVNIFILHAVLMATFLILPAKIEYITGLTSLHVWHFYLPVLGASLCLIAPFLRHAERLAWQQKGLQFAMIGLGMAIFLLINTMHLSIFIIAAILFFTAFNYLEASFPALVSRIASQRGKGAALGVYSFSQFLGLFSGGALGGCLQQWKGSWGIGIGCLLLTAVGWVTIRRLDYLKNSVNSRSKQWQEA